MISGNLQGETKKFVEIQRKNLMFQLVYYKERRRGQSVQWFQGRGVPGVGGGGEWGVGGGSSVCMTKALINKVSLSTLLYKPRLITFVKGLFSLHCVNSSSGTDSRQSVGCKNHEKPTIPKHPLFGRNQ